MGTREIIRIDEKKCNGCGECITSCAEGALALVDGKAKLVKELYCDGFGDCIGTCPTGALTIEKREAEEFSFEETRKMLQQTQGEEAVQRLEHAHTKHSAAEKLKISPPTQGGCPGSRMRFENQQAAESDPTDNKNGPKQAIRSELNQWPIQLHLVMPNAPFFKNKELVVLSTCSPVASADIHWRFLRGRSTVIACPKFDRTEPYVEKLAQILAEPSIPKVLIVRMEVPCCGGLTQILQQAVRQSGRCDLEVEEVVVGLNGNIE